MAGTGKSSIRSYNFFVNSTVQSGGFPANQHEFVDVDDGTPFLSHSVVIANDSANDIDFRFSPDPGTGASHGQVSNGETLQLDFKRARRIFLSGTAGSAFRLWAW